MNQISEEPEMNSSEIGYLQDDGQVDESPPIVVYVEDAKRKKQYKCRYCQLSHHSMKYVSQLHRYKCKERKKIKAVEVHRRTRERISQQKVEEMQNRRNENEQVQNNAAPNEQKNDEEGQDAPLKKRVKVLEQNYMRITESNHLSSVNKSKLADIFARQVFDDIGSLLISNLRAMFKSAAEKALHSGMDIVSQKNAISESLIYSVQNVKIGEVFFDFMECLRTAHTKLQKKHSQQTRTYQNNERAFEFFSKFNHFHFEYQVTLLKEMMELKKFPRNDYIRYFNCLREIDSFFSKFPKMNRIDGKISNPRPLISLQQVIQKVVELQVSNHLTLCCDIWFCATLGLRGSQLLRISVVASDGRFAKSIKIEERKNSNIAVRYLPQSLIQLIRFTKTSYPLNLQRLKEAKNICIEAFRSFYTLRHTCLTAILSALASLNEYGRFHKSSLTTSKYYINKNQEKLVNSVFKLPFKYQNSSIALDYERDIMLDFCGPVATEIKLQPNKEFQISVDTNQKFSEQQDADSILTGDTISETSSLNERERIKMNCQVYLYKNFKSSVVYGSSDIIGALKKYVNPNTQADFENALQQQLAGEGHYPDVISCIEKTSKILKLKILYYEFIEGYSDPQVHKIGKGTTQAVLSKIGNDFFVDDDIVISKLVQDFDSLSIKSNQSDKLPLHTNRNPLCNRCGQSKKRIHLEYGIENDEILLFCPKCQYNRVICEISKPRTKPELRENYVKITSKYKKTIKNTFNFIGYMSTKNNFLEVVQKDFGRGSHAQESLFSKSIPDQMKSFYLRMSEELENQIQMNRDYQLLLPLTIKKSTISRGGRGVFSLQPIKKNTIILTYIGIGCDVTEIDLKDDSLFSLGWVQFSEADPKQLYLMPRFSLNAARYINSADKLNQANCRVGMGIFKNREIVIFIYSSRQIKAHQQLFYPYSNKTYWKNKKE